MANQGFEIPTDMRDFAEKSVERARKAFEGFVEAAQKAQNAVDVAASTAQGGARDASAKALGFAEQNVAAAFELASKVVKAKDIHEVVNLQTEFVKTQMASIGAQAQAFGDTIRKAGKA
ncbi:MAG: phasin [Hyphomicrobiales bacterium]|nr:phasin [Hyphomicrobiales bacterium]